MPAPPRAEKPSEEAEGGGAALAVTVGRGAGRCGRGSTCIADCTGGAAGRGAAARGAGAGRGAGSGRRRFGRGDRTPWGRPAGPARRVRAPVRRRPAQPVPRWRAPAGPRRPLRRRRALPPGAGRAVPRWRWPSAWRCHRPAARSARTAMARQRELPRTGYPALNIRLADELRRRHGIERQMPLRHLAQAVRFVQQRPFGAQHLGALARLLWCGG